MKLLLATTSAGKLREQREALLGPGLDLDLVALRDLPPLAPPDEPGPSFEDNAAVKALYYHRETKLAALGEDSGLVIDALGGQPGIHSARWLGPTTPYAVKNREVLNRLRDVPDEERTARYVSAVTLAEDGAIAFRAIATCEGRIAHAPSGDGGFGYDPIFWFPPLGCTMAELSAAQKSSVSHRGKAMAELRSYFENR